MPELLCDAVVRNATIAPVDSRCNSCWERAVQAKALWSVVSSLLSPTTWCLGVEIQNDSGQLPPGCPRTSTAYVRDKAGSPDVWSLMCGPCTDGFQSSLHGTESTGSQNPLPSWLTVLSA